MGHGIILFVFYIFAFLSDYYDTYTYYIKQENEEIFLLEISQFNGLFLFYIKSFFKQ